MNAPLACVWWPHARAEPPSTRCAWLRHWTPFVEAAAAPGLFFLDAAGLDGLFCDQARWADALANACAADAAPGPVYILLGHHKVALWALARALHAGLCPSERARGWSGWASPARECAAVRGVPLALLGLPAGVLAAATRMRLRTVGDVLPLPLPSVRAHVGAPLAEWLASLQRPSAPLRRHVPLPPVIATTELELASHDHVQLLFLCRPLLTTVLFEAAARRQAVAAIYVYARYEGKTAPPPFVQRIETARPGRDETQWLLVLRLMLEHARLAAPVIALGLRAQLVWPGRAEQLTLWPQQSAHESRATCDALAKVRSAWGATAVTVAALTPGHLPEAQYVWRPWQGEALPVARPRAERSGDVTQQGRPPRVRALWPQVRPLPWAALLPMRAQAAPPGAWWRGPYPVNVGWWQATPCDRDYVYLGRAGHAPVWAYYDRQQRRWWWQGVVD